MSTQYDKKNFLFLRFLEGSSSSSYCIELIKDPLI